MAWKSTRQRKWEHNVEVKLLETKDPVGSLWEGFFSKEHWACWAGAACRAFCQRMELYTLFLNSFIIYIICQPALLFPPFLILHRTEDKGLTMGSGVALLQKMPLQTPIPPQHHWVVKLRFSCTAHRVIHYFRKKKKKKKFIWHAEVKLGEEHWEVTNMKMMHGSCPATFPKLLF